MFACQQCGATTFTLQASVPLPQIGVSLNHAHEVVIKVEGHEPFVADTKFMNQFAHCQGCGATQCWLPTTPA
jgi:hypothetical protein